MKRKIKRTFRSCVSMLLVLCMVIGFFPASVFATDGDTGAETIHYVSLGDSMTNGYGFVGYDQGGSSAEKRGYDLLTQEYVYGGAAYPNLFADYLMYQGYSVSHTQLALSATLAEDLLYILGGREDEAPDGWGGMLDYMGRYDNTDEGLNQVKDYFQENIADADIITMCLGNASFGAYLLNRITDVLGIFGAELEGDEKVTLEDALSVAGLDEEQMELVNQVYAYLVENLVNQIPAEYAHYNVEEICNLITYATASFLVNYKLCIDQILELNEKDNLEIILVGMMNTTYGINVVLEDGSKLPVGDIMDGVFDLLNAYVAGLPAAMQLAGQWQDATFYYAEQDHVEFICQKFTDLKNNGWVDSGDGLSAATVRDRNISAYNDTLKNVLSAAFSSQLSGMELAEVTQTSINNFNSYSHKSFGEIDTAPDAEAAAKTVSEYISTAIYLALEAATAESTQTLDIPVEGLEAIAGNNYTDIFSGFTMDNSTPAALSESLETYLTSDPTLMGMCKIYALFMVGNGMSVHPTPKAHKDIYETIVAAYESGHTAQDQTIENLKKALGLLQGLVDEYYDDACIYAYNYAVENGYVDMAVAALDELMVQLKDLEDAYGAQVQATVDTALAQLEEAKAILEDTVSLGKDTLDQILDLMEAVNDALQNLGCGGVATVSLEETSTEAALDAAIAEIQAAVQAAMAEISAKLGAALGVGADYVMNYAQEALHQLADATAALAQEYAPEVADYIYNWLYDHPATVIDFINTYGDDAVAFMAQYGQDAMKVLGFILYNYGEDIANLVLDNADVIIATLVDWYQVHGENTWALIQVYLEELGIIDAIENGIADASQAIQEILAQLDAAIYGKVIDNVDDLMNMLDDLLDQADAVNADIAAQIEALNTAIAELQAALETMADEGTEAAKAALDQAAADIQAAVDEITAQINAKAAEIDAEIAAQVAAMKAQIDAAIAELTEIANQSYKDLTEALENLGAMLDQISGEAYEQLIAELDKVLTQLDAIMDKAQNIGATAQAELENLYAAVEEFQLAAELFVNEGAAAANLPLQTAVYHVATAVENVLYAISEDAAAEADGILADVNQLLAELYLSATHATLTGCQDKNYVAIGDDTVLGENSYADMLSEELDFAKETKIAASGLMVQDSAALIQANIASIAQADMITLGFGNAAFIKDAVNKFDNLIEGKENTFDWSSIVTDEGVQYVEQALKALEEQLDKAGISGTIGTTGLDAKLLAMTLIETYVYDAAAYAVGMPKLVESIREINSEAVVAIVGMYNPFKGVTLNMNGTTVDLGQYLDYLVAGVTAHGIAYCMISGNAIFVEAPAVEVANTTTEMDLVSMMMQLFLHMENFYPTEDGHAYVKDQILGALTIVGDHDLKYVAAVAETCTTDGCEAYYECRVCGKIFKDAQGQEETTLEDLCIPAGHSLTKVKKLDPTCTVAGHNEYYVCQVCDAAFKDDQAKTATTVEAETIKAKGHNETVQNAKKATCTEKGYTGDTVCTNCQKVLKKGTEIKATGHDWVGVVTTAPTYRTTGVMTYTCKNNSKHTYTEVIAALCDFTEKNCPLAKFSDTEIEAWYHDGLHYCIENGLMNGFPDGTFRPGDAKDETSYATRAQVVTVLWRLAGSPEVDQKLTFTDVDEGAWYMPALRWAVKNNVVEGYPDNTFKPNDLVNRQTAATLFCRYFTGKLEATVTGAVKNSGLKDYAELHPWAEGYMDWAFENGLFIGFEDNTLRPTDGTTRAQLATLLYRHLTK